MLLNDAAQDTEGIDNHLEGATYHFQPQTLHPHPSSLFSLKTLPEDILGGLLWGSTTFFCFRVTEDLGPFLLSLPHIGHGLIPWPLLVSINVCRG